MKELFKAYEATQKANNEAFEAWEQEPENEELEATFDRTYEAYIKANRALVEAIVTITNGAIDAGIAKRMIATKRDELKSLIEQMA
jgi:hypothetical protein